MKEAMKEKPKATKSTFASSHSKPHRRGQQPTQHRPLFIPGRRVPKYEHEVNIRKITKKVVNKIGKIKPNTDITTNVSTKVKLFLFFIVPEGKMPYL